MYYTEFWLIRFGDLLTIKNIKNYKFLKEKTEDMKRYFIIVSPYG